MPFLWIYCDFARMCLKVFALSPSLLSVSLDHASLTECQEWVGRGMWFWYDWPTWLVFLLDLNLKIGKFM